MSLQLWPSPVPLWQLSHWLGQDDLDLPNVSQHCLAQQQFLHRHVHTQSQQVVSAYKRIRWLAHCNSQTWLPVYCQTCIAQASERTCFVVSACTCAPAAGSVGPRRPGLPSLMVHLRISTATVHHRELLLAPAMQSKVSLLCTSVMLFVTNDGHLEGIVRY